MASNIKHIIILLGIFSFLTPPLISQVNSYFNDGFESISDFGNWQQEKISGNADWTLNSGLPFGNYDQAFEGQNNACFTSYNYNNDQTMLSSPVLDLSQEQNLILKFNVLQPAWGLDQDKLKVYYRSDTNNNWILLSTYNNNIDIWTDVLVPLPDASATYQIAFLAESHYGYGIAIDNVSIIDGESCDMVDNFEFINIKESSVFVSWEDSGDNTYEIEYGLEGYTLGNGDRLSNIKSKCTHINNLINGENYSMYIRTYCENGVSNWNGPYNFNAECTIGQQIPYTESFENTESSLECWNVIYPSTDCNPENQVVVNDDIAFSGENSLRFSSYEVGSPYDQFLVSPNILSDDTLELSFRYKTISGSEEIFELGLSTTPENPLGNVNWEEEVTDADENWKVYKALIEPGITNFVIHYNSVYEYYLYVDDIRLNFPGQCDVAESIYVSDITETSAVLSWSGDAYEYIVEYGYADFAKGQGDFVSGINDNNVLLSELIPEVDYTAYIITKCGGMNLYSDPIYFTTQNSNQCDPVIEIFTDSISNNFARINWLNESENTHWNLEFGISGFTLGEGTFVDNLPENTFDIKYLEIDKEYDVYIQAICSETSELTNWSEKHTFKTSADSIIDDNQDSISLNKPSVELYAKDSTIYICDYNMDNIIIADLELVNSGNTLIQEGLKVTYSIDLGSKGNTLQFEIILPSDLQPNESYSFKNEFIINDLEHVDYLTIKLTKKWDTNNIKSDHIEIVPVTGEIIFEDENDGTIEVSQLPELISANYISNINHDEIEYIWTDNAQGNSRFVESEGIYTLTVSTEQCQYSKSINIVKENIEIPSEFEIYPNPSQGGLVNLVSNTEEIVNVIIYDSTGRNVFSKSLTQIVQQVDLSFLASGIYNVAFILNDNVELKRLYIE